MIFLWAELRGRSHLSRSRAAAIAQRSDACVTSYWVYCLTLKSAGLAAKLPLGENEGKCPVPCGQRGQDFPVGGTLERKGEDCD